MITTKVFSSPIGNFNLVYYVPDNATGPLPVFIMFPGSGESGNDPSKAYVNGPMAFVKNGWTPNFIIAFAQTPYTYGTYNNPAAIPFLRAAIQAVISNLPVDKSKIYLTGLSYGADHVMRYIQSEDDAHYVPIAGIIVMSMAMSGSVGTSPNDSLGGNDTRLAKMRIIGFCGTQDSFFQSMQRFFTVLLKGAGYNEDFISYNAGHSGWNQFYDNNYKGPKGLNIYDDAIQSTTPAPVVAPPVVVPPPVTKTIKSILITYSDNTQQTLP